MDGGTLVAALVAIVLTLLAVLFWSLVFSDNNKQTDQQKWSEAIQSGGDHYVVGIGGSILGALIALIWTWEQAFTGVRS